MNELNLHLPDNHQETLDRFITACQADERIVAAYIVGSYARGDVDQYSDMDVFFITTDEAYEVFLAEKEDFIRRLGEPLFLEDFGVPNGYLVIYANGSEADIFFNRESQYKERHTTGPYRVLLDKKGILTGVVFPEDEADPAEQVKVLRQQMDWFWHDMSHFVKAIGRRQLWFAHGELEIIRGYCVNLARLRYNFADPYVGEEPYFKVENALPVEELVPLAGTFCPLEYGAMLQAAQDLFDFYREIAPALAQEHGLTYQLILEQRLKSQLAGLVDM